MRAVAKGLTVYTVASSDSGVNRLESVVERLIAAVVPGPADRSISFLWDSQEPRSRFGPRGCTFFFDNATLQRAALDLLTDQATLLAGMPLNEAESLLLEFFRYHLHLFDPSAASGPQQPISVATQARALLAYIREIRQNKLYLIPARRLAVPADFVGSRVLLIHAAENLSEALARCPLDVPPMNGLQFPPFAHDKPAGELLAKDSWIGCISPSDQGAYNLLEALLGAISLLLPLPHSRTFSMASRVPYIYCVGGRWIWRLDGPKFPPLGNDHQLTNIDVAVLRSLFDGEREEDAQRRLELGLQFAGAGWAPPGRFSFLHNAISFDALFGENGRVRAAIQEKVTHLAAAVSSIEDRIKRLIKIRNALLHGEINAVEGSSEYMRYYEAFNCDPQLDQVRILATCVRSIAGEDPK